MALPGSLDPKGVLAVNIDVPRCNDDDDSDAVKALKRDTADALIESIRLQLISDSFDSLEFRDWLVFRMGQDEARIAAAVRREQDAARRAALAVKEAELDKLRAEVVKLRCEVGTWFDIGDRVVELPGGMVVEVADVREIKYSNPARQQFRAAGSGAWLHSDKYRRVKRRD